MPLELQPLTRATAPPVDAFYSAVDESRTSLMRWMPWCHPAYGPADVERWYVEADRQWDPLESTCRHASLSIL